MAKQKISSQNSNSLPHLGFGLGLRPKHYPHIFEHWPEVDFFEIISENFMDTDGKPKRNLARIREHYPVVMHGVALSIGTIDPLNSEYLQKLKALIDWLNPAWVSDHLCWTGIAHRNTHDLLPVPYTEEALKHITERIKQVQDFIQRPITLENPSTYLEFKSSTIMEAEFIARMAEDSGCNLLLDVNNVYVTCFNHRLDPKEYIDTLPLDKVQQIHLSGHSNFGTHIIDTHDNYVIDDVWKIYKYVVQKAGFTPNTMVEWDANIPEFGTLYNELEKAKINAANAADYDDLPLLSKPNLNHIKNEPILLQTEQLKMQDAIILRTDSKPDDWIRAKEQFSAKSQLDVYINAYRYRLIDVVAEDYPVLEHYLGKKDFDILVTDFVNNVASEHFNIGRYTDKFPDFVAKNCHKNNQQDIFAYEICLLETALCQLADSTETKPLSNEDLQNLTAETLLETKFIPRAASRLFKFLYPVNRYFREVMEELNPVAPKIETTYLAVLRHDDIMWRMELEEDEYNILQMLFAGDSVGVALDKLHMEFNIEESTLSTKLYEWFGRWMKHNLFMSPYVYT